MNIILHEDRCALSSLSSNVQDALRSENLILADQVQLDFCGVIIRNRTVDIFLPRNSDTTILNDHRKIGSLLVRAIHKYIQHRSRASKSDGNNENIIGNSFIGIAFSLFSDYVENGLFIKKTEKITRNSGKTCWKRTIGRMQSYPSSGSPIYLDTYGRYKHRLYNEEVTRIHAKVVRELDRLLGWIYFDDDPGIQLELANIQLPISNEREQIKILETELGILYSDREMRLMKNLINYLSDQSTKNDDNFIIGIDKFHAIWEHMVDSCMTWKFDINHLLAKPSYKINGKFQIATQKGGRTDTVLRNYSTDIFAVIDAKYYGANNLTNLPGWPDLIKQFFYALALRDIFPTATVHNYFIFPGSFNGVESAHLQDPNTAELQDNIYAPITCIYINPIILIECYITGKKLKHISEQLLHI